MKSYFFAYPERRYKRKIKAKNSLLESEKSYNRRTLYGGLIGAGRGLVSGLVCLHYTHLTSRLQSSGGLIEAVPETDVGQQLALSSHNQHDGLGGFSKMGAFICLVQTIQIP